MAILQKGNTWKKKKHTMPMPCIVETKIDEVRCHIIINDDDTVTFQSYAEKPLYNMERFAPFWLTLAKTVNIKEFDTGFEVNGNFDDTRAYIGSSKNLREELKQGSFLFILFDLPNSPLIYSERRIAMRTLINLDIPKDFALVEPESITADSIEAVEKRYEEVTRQGHEGVMVKDPNHLYAKGKRTNTWLKLKPEEDADGKIIGFTEAVSEEGMPLARVGSLELELEDGSKANVGGIKHELAKHMFNAFEEYRNEWCEFRYMERDSKGGYRHPKFHRLREAKA